MACQAKVILGVACAWDLARGSAVSGVLGQIDMPIRRELNTLALQQEPLYLVTFPSQGYLTLRIHDAMPGQVVLLRRTVEYTGDLTRPVGKPGPSGHRSIGQHMTPGNVANDFDDPSAACLHEEDLRGAPAL